MINRFNRYWNSSILGFPKFTAILIKVSFLSFYESVSTLFWKFNLGQYGKNILIQKGTKIKFPKQIRLNDGVRIGRNCQISSEFDDSYFIIDENTHIDKMCLIDFSGDLKIGKNVTISEGCMIETHDHGYFPRSKPQKKPLEIEDNVWIGARALILPTVNKIGANSIIGAGCVVTKTVEEKNIVAGNPSKMIGQNQ